MENSSFRLVGFILLLFPLAGAYGQSGHPPVHKKTAHPFVRKVFSKAALPKKPIANSALESPTAFGYPEGPTVPLPSFVMLTSTMPLLPLSGGIYVPGLNAWFLAPTEKPMQSVSYCAADTSTYVTVLGSQKVTVLQLKGGGNKTATTTFVGELPSGFYVAYALARGKGLIWGLNATGAGIWGWQQHKLSQLYRSKRPITAFTPLTPEAFAAAIDGNVLLFQGKSPPKQLVRCDRPVDGLSMTADGTVLASTRNGIIAVTPQKQWLVSGKVHGYLQVHKDKLYVLDTHDRKIVQVDILKPH